MNYRGTIGAMLKKLGWYPLSPVGRTLAAVYAMIPVYVTCSQVLGVFPPGLTTPIVGGMSLVTLCALTARHKKIQLFKLHPGKHNGFTLIELLVVISIIGILAALVLPSISTARKGAQLARAKAELRNIAVALERYALDYGGYPADVSRNLPPGLEVYLAGGVWPKAVWPASVFDWDNWGASDMDYPPNVQTQQISIRFCTAVGVCNFPNEAWAQGFDFYSSAYYCISGSCRAHADRPPTHPAYCINC